MRVLIVGAGSAGSILAERLSREPECHVTVVEAGPPAAGRALTDAHRLPIGPASPVTARYPANLTDAPDRPVSLVRGAVVGGSGAINGGYFCRGRAGDFDGWGVPGWSWDDVLPHFRALETDHDFTGPLHGASGPIPIRRTREFSAGTQQFVDAARDRGFDWIDDLNGDQTDRGVGALPLNVADGRRCGPGAVVLAPALGRPNLVLRTDTRVRSIRFAGYRATGVDVRGPSGDESLYADRIILCAGAIATAQLLMLSGCGPADSLTRAGVPVLADLPVGVGFADHPEWLLPTAWPASPGRTPLEAALAVGDLEIRLYTTGFAEMVGEVPSDPPHVGVALMRPAGRGRLTLMSADPTVPPRIEHHYDSVAGDVAALCEGADLARDIAGIGATEANWSTTQHLCGTAPLGAVLDARCRVLGVDGLWVADGSILPEITSRGPHATIAMIGHRVAEFVTD
ncbi:mycofactocin system GMC family oxidoreductase MftG [Mycolicibacterium bacteremicum]|uniref:mycofactocin dehydrogenase MftG n=1 Tax=Mycolicibacterium bacteremicum TaxID=564198 RepID=UPI0026ED114D|nr:mycofactocin system GMC family oxidoreductase MftG [Mycolicibacterium bacteremicum]